MNLRNAYLSALSVLALSVLVLVPAKAQNPAPTAPGATSINVNQAKALFDKGAKFVDVRLEEIRAKSGHIPRSMELGVKWFDDSKLRNFARKDEDVVFYCTNADCANPYFAAISASQWGYRKIYQLRDGFDAWKASGLPVDQ